MYALSRENKRDQNADDDESKRPAQPVPVLPHPLVPDPTSHSEAKEKQPHRHRHKKRKKKKHRHHRKSHSQDKQTRSETNVRREDKYKSPPFAQLDPISDVKSASIAQPSNGAGIASAGGMQAVDRRACTYEKGMYIQEYDSNQEQERTPPTAMYGNVKSDNMTKPGVIAVRPTGVCGPGMDEEDQLYASNAIQDLNSAHPQEEVEARRVSDNEVVQDYEEKTKIQQSDCRETAADTRRVRVHGVSPPTLPGAVWEGGSHNGDGDEMASFSQEDPEPTIPVQPKEPEEILVRANVVDDPVLVSASQMTCTCNGCPYGKLTALPSILASIGSSCNWLNAFLGIYYFDNHVDILSCVLGGVGVTALIVSTSLSFNTFSSRSMRILSGMYMLLAVTSLFTILTMRRMYSNVEYNHPKYYPGKIALPIMAFFTYSGAAAFTLYLDTALQNHRIAAWSCCPYGGRFTALAAVLGGAGSASAFVAVNVIFAVARDTYADYDYVILRYVGLNDETLLKFAGLLGYISACLGVFCLLASILLSCNTPTEHFIKILGSIYVALGVMSLLMLVALASETCRDNDGCTLDIGGIFAILAFFAYIGAGISTFYLNRTRLRQTGGSPI